MPPKVPTFSTTWRCLLVVLSAPGLLGRLLWNWFITGTAWKLAMGTKTKPAVHICIGRMFKYLVPLRVQLLYSTQHYPNWWAHNHSAVTTEYLWLGLYYMSLHMYIYIYLHIIYKEYIYIYKQIWSNDHGPPSATPHGMFDSLHTPTSRRGNGCVHT